MPKADVAGAAYKIPHVGWNSVEWDEPDPLFDSLESGEYFYFTHSFAAPESAATIGRTTHSVTFPCAVPGRPVWGVQFHPEKSSDAGARLLANFVTVARAAADRRGAAATMAEDTVLSKE
jgi:glutamine amidotransferase